MATNITPHFQLVAVTRDMYERAIETCAEGGLGGGKVSDALEPLTEAAWRLPPPVIDAGGQLETTAVAQHRLGLDTVRAFTRDILPLIEIVSADQTLHDSATAALLAANRRQLSLVDCVSFEVMRARQLTRAFAFDSQFAEQGFAAP